MAPQKLKRLVHRYNLICILHGSILMTAALFAWIATVYATVIITVAVRSIDTDDILERLAAPWSYLDPISCLLVAFVVAFAVWIGFFHTELFFTIQTDTDLRAARGVTTLHFLTPSWTTLALTIVCLAPILTWQALDAFRQYMTPNRSKVLLALTLYHYLHNWGDWVPYPKFESQRQAIILLARLGLVRVSRRFGKHQVKLVGGQPRWRKKTQS